MEGECVAIKLRLFVQVEHHKVDYTGYLVDLDDGIIFLPLRVEVVLGAGVEVHHYAGSFQLGLQFLIKVTPGAQVSDVFAQDILFTVQLIQCPHGIFHLIKDGFSAHAALALFGSCVCFLQDFDGIRIAGDHLQLPDLSLVWGIDVAYDMHHSQVLQVFQEAVIIRMMQHKVIFLHLLDHTLASCAKRPLSIFCAALERFSSSSKKRIILRMASS